MTQKNSNSYQETALRNAFDAIMAQVPERYSWASFKTLAYSSKVKHLTQARWEQIVNRLEEVTRLQPDRNIILYGPAGTGKTTLMAAIYRRTANVEAMARANGGGNVLPHWLDMFDWPEQALNYNFGNTKVKPRLTAHDVQCAAHRSQYQLFLDEYDKVGNIEQRLNVVGALMHAAYSKGRDTLGTRSRFVITTNLTKDDFKAKYGDHIFRRAEEDGEALHVNLFINEVVKKQGETR